jgi:hypothetical protein
MAGLDPAIHPLRNTLFSSALSRAMDARVKPAHDGWWKRSDRAYFSRVSPPRRRFTA